jgi:hypothetical protein
VERYTRLQKVRRMLVVLDQTLKNKQSVGVSGSEDPACSGRRSTRGQLQMEVTKRDCLSFFMNLTKKGC